MKILRVIQTTMGWLLPLRCLVCQTPLLSNDQRRLCPKCWEGLERLHPWLCQRCSLPLPDGGAHCARCRVHPPLPLTQIRAGGVYQGTLRRCLQQFKYGRKECFARALGELAVEGIQRPPATEPYEVIVPVPLDYWRRWRRGYNQAELLAHQVGSCLHLPVIPQALQKTRRTRRQVGLSRADRLRNLAAAFRVRQPASIQGKRVLLIDDVCTTGTTLQECAKALRRGGAAKVWGGVVARDC